jgi:hypothetical protein
MMIVSLPASMKSTIGHSILRKICLGTECGVYGFPPFPSQGLSGGDDPASFLAGAPKDITARVSNEAVRPRIPIQQPALY